MHYLDANSKLSYQLDEQAIESEVFFYLSPTNLHYLILVLDKFKK